MLLRYFVRHIHQKPHRIYLSRDEKSFISYHPDLDHPYECTRPMPKIQQTSDSVLKVDSHNMITKTPNLEQVQALTFTPSMYWKHFVGKEKRDKYKDSFNDNVDRKGLTS